MNRLILIIAALAGFAMGMKAQDDADAKYATELLKPGTQAPDFTIANAGTDYDGLSLSSLRGKYVVLDFWASWCPDCRKDIGTVRDMNRRMGSDSIVFVSISFDKSEDAWRKCVADSAMTWMQHREQKPWKETQISKDYHINWIPSMYLIGPDGRVKLGTVMADKLDRMLRILSKSAKHAAPAHGNASRTGFMQTTDSILAIRYEGGRKSLIKALSGSMQYPEAATKAKAEGVVMMRFALNPDGTLSDIVAANCRVTKLGDADKYTSDEKKQLNAALSKDFAREALRVLKSVKGWKAAPGSQKITMTLPVTFAGFF